MSIDIENHIKIEVLDKINCNFESYKRWMSDWEIVKFTESRFTYPTYQDLESYVESKLKSDRDYLYGIFYDDEHIGNIKIGNINWIDRKCDVGVIIGDKRYWGIGVAKLAIKSILDIAFLRLGLHKVLAGVVSENIASIKTFKKVGFKEVGVLREDFFYEGKFIDTLLFEMIKREYKR